MKAPAELAALLGGLGIDRSVRVVVYDAGGLEAPFLAYALHRLGHGNVAVLDGGIDAWAKEAKLPLVAGGPPPALARRFEAAPNADIIMDSRQVAEAMAEPGTVVIDSRTVGQYQGLAYHPLQMRAGHIENSVNLPTMGFWTAEGFLKDPRASAWLLESRGITKDKRIIVTCTTGQAAAGAWWALKYLGYPNVVLHDGSWVSWERSPMMKK